MDDTIINFFKFNSFMYNTKEDRYYKPSEKVHFYNQLQTAIAKSVGAHVTVSEIQERWSYLRDAFTRIDIKILNGKSVTFYEKNLYKKLYFLKSHISHRKSSRQPTSPENKETSGQPPLRKTTINKKKSSSAMSTLKKLTGSTEESKKESFYETLMKLKKHKQETTFKTVSNETNKLIISMERYFKVKNYCYVLNDAIMSLGNTQLQRRGLLKILKSIKRFNSSGLVNICD